MRAGKKFADGGYVCVFPCSGEEAGETRDVAFLVGERGQYLTWCSDLLAYNTMVPQPDSRTGHCCFCGTKRNMRLVVLSGAKRPHKHVSNWYT